MRDNELIDSSIWSATLKTREKINSIFDVNTDLAIGINTESSAAPNIRCLKEAQLS